MGLILGFLAIAMAFQPGIIKIGVQNAPTVYYNIDKEEWTVPVYDETKYIINCIERDRVRCLRGK